MKKALIITYYWPPSGGPGVQRWLLFVKYLRDFGIEPILYIPENPHYPYFDSTLKRQIPKGLTILRNKIFEPYQLASFFSPKSVEQMSGGIIPLSDRSILDDILLWIRGNLFIPDSRKFWVKPSVKFLSEYLKENDDIKTIITTGPPHSLHLIGMGLQELLDVKWIADFRDPWTGIYYHERLKLLKSSKRKHKKLEKKVLQALDHLITTSFATKRMFSKITDKPIDVITNGYEVFNFDRMVLDEKFTLTHLGLLSAERNPRVLWEAFKELIDEVEGFASDFVLQLAGMISEDVLKTIKKHDFMDNVLLLGYISHDWSLKIQAASQVLLLVESDSLAGKNIIPGKLFQYMILKRPILAVGPVTSDIAQILDETQTGHYFNYEQKELLKQQIIIHYEEFKRGVLRVKAVNLEKYHRKNLTEELAAVIKKN